MAQKISQMKEQTTASMTEAGTSDFLGGYTTTGGNANRKFSLAGLANYFLNKFKMTLGGSSQTVKSAIDTLNSNSHGILGTLIPETADFDTYQTPGVYTTTNTTQNVHAPVSLASTAVRLFVEYRGIDSRVFQEAWVYKDSKFRTYCRVMSGAFEWSAWELQPTRAEVDTLNSKLTLSSSAKSVNAWTNDTNAVFEIIGATKKFSITVASNGSLSGSVTNL